MKHSNVSQSKFFINGHLNIQCECTPFTVCQSYKSLQLHPLGTSLLTLDKGFLGLISFPFNSLTAVSDQDKISLHYI